MINDQKFQATMSLLHIQAQRTVAVVIVLLIDKRIEGLVRWFGKQ